MKTKTKPAPLKITITGDLAAEIRAIAKQQGAAPAAIVKQHLRFGILTTDPGEEGQQFRREIAAGRVPALNLDEIGSDLAGRVADAAKARGATVSEFVESMIAQILPA